MVADDNFCYTTHDYTKKKRICLFQVCVRMCESVTMYNIGYELLYQNGFFAVSKETNWASVSLSLCVGTSASMYGNFAYDRRRKLASKMAQISLNTSQKLHIGMEHSKNCYKTFRSSRDGDGEESHSHIRRKEDESDPRKSFQIWNFCIIGLSFSKRKSILLVKQRSKYAVCVVSGLIWNYYYHTCLIFRTKTTTAHAYTQTTSISHTSPRRHHFILFYFVVLVIITNT